MTFSGLFLLFTLYSFIGWVCEVVYCSIPARRFINRGFLRGPVCPIYGVGAMLVVTLLNPFKGNVFLLFICAVLVTSIVEYITSWLLETIFGTKWWDYSHYKFNIHGRVCLLNSLLFGILSVLVVLFVQPFLAGFVGVIPGESQTILAWLAAAVFAVDLVITLRSLVSLDKQLARLRELTEGLKEIPGAAEWFAEHDLAGSVARLRQLAAANGEVWARVKDRFEALFIQNASVTRLMEAFPGIKSSEYGKQLDLLKAEVRRKYDEKKAARKASKEGRTETLAKNAKSGSSSLAAAGAQSAAFESSAPVQREAISARGGMSGAAVVLPGDAAVSADGQAVAVPRFAEGMNGYKLFWIFLIGCFVGTFLETIWCVLTTGTLQNRAGVIYGPFNPVYGAGALIMTLCLYRLRGKRDLWIFLGSMVIGGIFEYLCSLGQELIFGTVSWEYSDTPINVGGRTNIMFAFFWGVLGLLWVKDLYPYLSAQIERIPKKIGKPLTWVLAVFMVFNMAVSALAVGRQTERRNGVPADNAVREFLDTHYTDEYLRYKFPNMMVVEDAQSE